MVKERLSGVERLEVFHQRKKSVCSRYISRYVPISFFNQKNNDYCKVNQLDNAVRQEHFVNFISIIASFNIFIRNNGVGLNQRWSTT